MKTLYLVLAVLGGVLPMTQFVPWLRANGFNTHLFVQQLFANRISSFFALDLLLTAVVVVVFMRSRRSGLGPLQRWLPVAALLLLGVSCGLPLFLYFQPENSARA